MRARAALYREMAEELEDSGLFERRLAAHWIIVTLCSMVSPRPSDSYQALNGPNLISEATLNVLRLVAKSPQSETTTPSQVAPRSARHAPRSHPAARSA
jgi:hypothetical protein